MSIPSRRSSRSRRSRLVINISRLALVCALVGAAFLLPGSASGWVLNQAQFDDGSCGHAEYNPTLTARTTPWFLVYGNGGKSEYQMSLDGVPIGNFLSDIWMNVCVHSTTQLADGMHVLTGVEVKPVPGNVVTPFTFWVDTVPPEVPSAPSLAYNSDSGVKGDNITMYNNPMVTGTAQPSTSVALYDHGLSGVGGAVSTTAGVWTARTNPLTNGVHSLSASTSDSAGNVSPQSAAWGLTVDLILPAVSITSPGSGSTVSGNVNFEASASDSIGMSKVEFQVDGVLKATDTTSPYTCPWATTTVANGSHTLTAIATDVAGNFANSTFTVTVSNGAVSAPSAPSLNSATAGNGSVALSWSAPASDGGAAITGYRVYRSTVSGGESLLLTLGNVTGYSDPGLANGQTYYYQVSAVNSAGESVRSVERSATPVAAATAPGAPSLNSATAGNGSVVLSWSAPTSDGGAAITGFKVYRGTVSGGETLLVALGNVTGFTDFGLANGQTYYYQVSAVNSAGESVKSVERSATPTAPATVPGVPSLNSATAGNSSVVLSWSAPASDGGAPITVYKVYRSTVSGGESLLVTLGNVSGYSDLGLVNGQTYYYQVTAVNSAGESVKSVERSATPVAPATAPGAPSLNSATAGSNSVVLSWSAPASDGGAAISGYKVYRSTVSGAEVLLVTLGNVTGYTDLGLVNGQTYYYQVTAVNSAGESVKSVERSATPVAAATAPGAPSLNSATGGGNSVALSWSAPASNGGAAITGYRVYRSTVSGAEVLLVSLGNVSSYTDLGLLNGQTYYYQVTAVNSVGESVRSVERFATPVAAATAPGAPSLNSATGGSNSVVLSWSAPASDGGAAITGYKVYRSTVSGAGVLLVTLGNVSGYTDLGLLNGLTYYYQVTAVNSVGESVRSVERSATPVAAATAPGAPSLNSATAGNGSVVLSWSAPASNGGAAITGYKVYRSTVSGAEALLVSLGNVTGFTDFGLANGQTYYYQVTAVNSAGESVKSVERSATPVAAATAPGAPSLNSATGGGNSVALSWSAPASNGGAAITGYRVYRSTVSGAEVLLVSLGNVSSYTDLGLLNGQTYYYQVTAVNSVGESVRSVERFATPVAAATAPGAPSLNSATGGSNSVVLSWSAPASDGGAAITGYKVYRSTVSGAGVLLVTLGNVSGYTDLGLLNGLTYYYQVTAVNSVGESVRSVERSATPVAAATAPGAPSLNSATAGNGSVVLSWSAPASNGGAAITGYKVYRSTVSGAEALLVSLGNVTGFTDFGLANGQTYYYQVTAMNSVGESVKSVERFATPVAAATAPGAPSLNSASAASNSVVLSWSAPASNGGAAITGYKVYRSTVSGAEVLLVTLGNVTGYSDLGLSNGQTYYYQVTAVNSVGESVRSVERFATPVAAATVPGAPSFNSATAGSNSAVLSWSAPASDGGAAITGYKVYRSVVSGAGTLLVTLGNVSGYTDLGLLNGQTYYYQVTAVNSAGESIRSVERSATPVAAATAPGAPSFNSATGGSNSVALSWSAPASNGGAAITGYKVYRSTVSGAEVLLVTLGNVSGYTDLGLLNGLTYYYQVTAVNSVGESVRSVERSATPVAAATAPGAPSFNSATGGSNSVALSWSAPASNGGAAITGYKVYRSTVSGAGVLLVTLGNVSGYTDLGLLNGLTYYYQVTAVNSVGESVRSVERSATPVADATAPDAPSLNSATAGSNYVALSWSAPASDGGAEITGYNVYRSTFSGAEVLLVSLGDVTGYTDFGLLNGQTYYYQVTAVNSAGESVESVERSATPTAATFVSGAPSLNSATAGNGSVALSWSAPASDGGAAITGYKVYRSTFSGAEVLLVSLGNVTSYTNFGLVNGQTYYYQVTAVNSAGESARSAERSATPTAPATIPGAPFLNTATPGNRVVTLAWSAPAPNGSSPITGYRIYRSTVSGSATLFTSVGLVTSYADTSVSNGVTYYYSVSAVNSVGEGARSSERGALPAAVPSAPSNFAVAPNAAAGILLTWQASSNGGSPVTGYKIYRGTVSGALTLFATVGVSTSFTDTAVVGGTTYYYKMSAVNAIGESPFTTQKSATRGTPPSAPRSLVAKTASSVGVYLDWSSPSTNGGANVTGYRIYRRTATTSRVLVATIGNVTSYTNTSTVPGGFYYYVVTAVSPLGEGPVSNESGALAR